MHDKKSGLMSQGMEDKPLILVVDDQVQNIELLEAHLVPQGYEIIMAASGEEALEKLAGNRIDLVLLDVMMPGMDGFEVTRRIRRDETHRLLPIILVTALRESEDRVKGIEAGCDDFISKPFDKQELLARVRSLLKVKAYNDLKSNYRKELESEVSKRTEELKTLTVSLAESNKAIRRFVPEEFLKQLGKSAIEDVRLGDHAAMDMVVMFADIRDFSALSENMTPEETFSFINQYLASLGPSIRKHGGFIDKYGYPFCRGRILNIVEKDTGQYDSAIDLFWSSGACMIVRSDAWKICGGFDSAFFAHMEEIDLCWRFSKAGYRVSYTPDSVIYHVGGGALPYTSPFKTYLNFRNSLFLLYKNLPDKNFCRILFIRRLLDGLAAIYFLLKGSFESVKSVWRAHIDYYKNIGELKEKRKMVKNLETGNFSAPVLNKSIVFEFYARGNKTYRSLKTIK